MTWDDNDINAQCLSFSAEVSWIGTQAINLRRQDRSGESASADHKKGCWFFVNIEVSIPEDGGTLEGKRMVFQIT